MKNVKFTVEFIQHVLANGIDGDGQRCRFQKTESGELIFQQPWWHSAFASAIDGVDDLRHIKPSDICMDLQVVAATELYKRRYQKRFRVHEAIMPGTKVTFNAIVSDRVSESNLRMLIDRVGRFIGLSPFGHRLGFGKFKLLDLQVQESEARRREHDDGRTDEDRGEG